MPFMLLNAFFMMKAATSATALAVTVLNWRHHDSFVFSVLKDYHYWHLFLVDF